MSKISVDVSSARIPVLQVGYQGENEVTDVLFDISSWITEFGEGVAQLRVKRPGNSEEESYVLSLTITDGKAVWTVSETDTANKGNGKVQLSYLVGNIVKKAVIYPYKVGKSIVGADNPVDPFDSWIERSKAWAIGETLDGDNVPETDETYQNNAKHYAEQADILGSAQVVLAAEKVTLAAEQVTLATEKADAAAASEAAVNGVSTQLTTRMSAIETEQAVQDARMDTFTSLPEGSTSGNAELADIRVGADGTTYDTAGNAVRGQISGLKSDLDKLDDTVLDLALNVKLINAPLDINGYVKISGSINTIQNARNTGYVRVNANCKVAYRTTISEAGYEIAFFDNDKNLLADVSVAGGSGEVEKVIDLSLSQYSDVKYCIVSVYGSSYFGTSYCHIYAENNILDRLETVITDDEITSYIPDNGNHFNKDTVIVGKEVYVDGSIKNDSNSAISDFIPVYSKKQIFINNLPVYSGNNRFAYFYDENKEPISRASNISSTSSQYSYEIPNNASYFVFSVYQRWTDGSKDYENVMVTFNDYEEYKPYQLYADSIGGYKVSPIAKLGTSNKKMVIFGDSITETASISDDGSSYTEGTRTNWMTFAKSYLDTTNFKNYAKSGATYKDTSGGTYRQNVSEQITMAMADSNNDDAEIIVMALGTNDGGASIGDYDTAMAKTSLDDLDRTNLYEALRWAMWTLRNKYTNATCFVGMPIQRASGEQPTAMIEAIKKMANRYNFIIIDATNESGIIREFETSGASGRYLADGLHPNTDGSIKMAKLYSNAILRNFMIN